MKLSSIIIASAIAGTSAFAPVAPRVAIGSSLSMNKVPFYAQPEESEQATPEEEGTVAVQEEEMSLEAEIEELTQEEVRKMKKASNLRNANGVEYAPWMNISPEDEQEIRKMMKSKAEARRRRQIEEASATGALIMDSQAQELSGGGLRTKIIDGDVELEWTTSSETSTKGFLVKRRPARTEEFEVIASFEDWGPLASKGPEGGSYRYLDSTISPGGWVYRITECDTNGQTNDMCQALVDVQTQEEQRGAVIAAAGFVVFAIAAVVAGVMLDPVGGY